MNDDERILALPRVFEYIRENYEKDERCEDMLVLAIDEAERLGFRSFLVELDFLNGRSRLDGARIESLVRY